MIDSHCHLNDERFNEDLAEVFARAGEAGVRKLVVVGYDLASSRRTVELAQEARQLGEPEIFAVVGISTHESANWNSETDQIIRDLLNETGVVGVGETGLDDHYPDPPRADQERSLRAQLAIAKDHRVPVVFHLREAAPDFFRILDEEQFDGPGVLHCFTGDEWAMREGVSRGLFISFSGIVTFNKAKDLLAVAKVTPLDHLLVETDAPYLAPIPHRGKRCEPCHVADTARFIAAERGESYEDFEAAMERNLGKLFPLTQ